MNFSKNIVHFLVEKPVDFESLKMLLNQSNKRNNNKDLNINDNEKILGRPIYNFSR